MKHHLALFLFLITFVCFSCNKKPEQGNILPKQQMIDIMADFYMAEAHISYIPNATPDSLKKVANSYYADILKKHNISFEQFSKSFDYYSEDLEEMEGIYEKVLEKYY